MSFDSCSLRFWEEQGWEVFCSCYLQPVKAITFSSNLVLSTTKHSKTRVWWVPFGNSQTEALPLSIPSVTCQQQPGSYFGDIPRGTSAAARAARYMIHDEICFHKDYCQTVSEFCLNLMLIPIPKAHNIYYHNGRKTRYKSRSWDVFRFFSNL